MVSNDIKCLMKTTFRPNIQSRVSSCDKTLREFVTKNGEQIKEVVCDYGNGLRTKSEVFNNKIVNTLSNGDVIEYTKNHIGDVLIKEGNNIKVNSNPRLWNDLLSNIFNGF